MIENKTGIRGTLLIELFGPDGALKQHKEVTNICTDQGDILFASLAYTAAPTFNLKLGSAATATSKTKANAGAYIASGNGSADYVTGSQLGMDASYPQAGTSTPGSGSQCVFKRTWAAGVATATINRVGLVNSTEGTNPSDGTLTYAVALTGAITKGSGDTLAITWTVTFLDPDMEIYPGVEPTVTLGPFEDKVTQALITSGAPTITLRIAGAAFQAAVGVVGALDVNGCCSYTFDPTELSSPGEIYLQATVGNSMVYFRRDNVTSVPTTIDAANQMGVPLGVVVAGDAAVAGIYVPNGMDLFGTVLFSNISGLTTDLVNDPQGNGHYGFGIRLGDDEGNVIAIWTRPTGGGVIGSYTPPAGHAAVTAIARGIPVTDANGAVSCYGGGGGTYSV